jgi:dolichol-phosphate mannosyltransferase
MAMPQTVIDTGRHQPDLHQRGANGVPAITIPTDDAEAALRFCRRLAGLIDDECELASIGKPRTVVHTPDAKQLSPDLSVVMPVFNEQENLLALHARLSTVLQQIGLSYEIVFVDDGSRDGSLDLLRDLAADDSHMLVVELSPKTIPRPQVRRISPAPAWSVG